jgi:hypothetical protein
VPFRVALVQFDHAVAHRLQKPPIVGNHHERKIHPRHELLQPKNARHVQVVGGFVQKEQVRPAHHLGEDRQPFPPPAGQRFHPLFRGETRPRQSVLHADVNFIVLQILTLERARELGLKGGVLPVGETVLLGQITHAEAAPHGPFPVVGFFNPGQDLKQGGFSGPRSAQ